MNKLKITYDFKKEINSLLEKQGKDIVSDIKNNFGLGSAPDIDSGKLRDSINYEVENEKVVVNAGVDYAASLEFGTRNMSPRPFLRPALNRIKL